MATAPAQSWESDENITADTRQHSARAASAALLIVLLAGLLFVGSIGLHLDWSFQLLTSWASITVVISISYLLLWGYHWNSAPVIFLAYLAMYHLTAAVIVMLVPAVINLLPAYMTDWLFTAGARIALFCTSIAILSFALGCTIFPGARITLKTEELEEQFYHPALFYGGLGLQVAAALLFGIIVMQAGGLAAFGAAYLQFRELIVNAAAFPLAIYLLGVGTIATAAAAPKTRWWWSFPIFILVAVPLLAAGSRGPVMFSALALLIVLFRRGVQIPRSLLLAALLVVITFSSAIRGVRDNGVAQIDSADVAGPSALLGLMDFGSALWPASVAANWIAGGEPYLLGGSYWLPVERSLAYISPLIWGRDLDYNDPRLLAYQVIARTGSALGFSSVGEAFSNFGYLGVLVVFAVLGVAIGWLYRKANNGIYLTLLGAVLMTAINNVRNTFIFVPGQLIASITIVFVLHQLYLFQQSRR